MKRIAICCTILAGLLFASGVHAQEKHPAYLGEIRVAADSLRSQGDSLPIEINVSVRNVMIRSGNSLVLTPVLESGTKSVELPEIIINGTRRDKMYRRAVAMNRQNPFPAPYTVLRANKRSRATIDYRIVLPMESWMMPSTLTFYEKLYECNGKQRLVSKATLATLMPEPQPAPIQIIPVPIVATPPPVEIPEPQVFQKEGEAFLDFPVGQWRILRNYRNNATELDRINATLDSVFRNKDATIKAIYLTGYASPEGSYELNEKLSKNRADAFRTYLMERYGYSPGLYHVDWRGEDWSGLTQLIQDSSMPWKESVLEIIRETDVFDGRETKLMNLEGGNPYRYMSQYFFPKLRKVQYKILYTITEPGK